MRGGFASAWFGLNHAELVALDVGERRPLEVFVLDIPQTRGAESDEALDLGLTVRRVPVDMHSILRDLALGHLHEVEARSAGERGPLTGIAFGQFAAQCGRPEMADPLGVASVEYDREERESRFLKVRRSTFRGNVGVCMASRCGALTLFGIHGFRSASRNIPTSNARKKRSSSQSISSADDFGPMGGIVRA
jgi:hypothetical protein